jgi:hypothetical protein
MFKLHRLTTLLFTVAAGIPAVVSMVSCVPASATAGTCGNEVVRAEQSSSFLPECRAYELVSPAGATVYLRAGGLVDGARAAEGHSAGDGGISWSSYYPPPGFSSESMHFLSKRDTSGWNTRSVMPTQSTSSGAFIECGGYAYFSADLTKEVLSDGQAQCPHNDPPLTEDEPEGFENLFLHDVASESYGLVNLTPGSEMPANAQLQDTSVDFTHIVFSEAAKLTPSAPAGEVLYEWAGGRVHLVSILPNGTAVPGELVDGAPKGSYVVGFAPFVHSVSTDGSRVIFESGGNLYERVNAEMEQSLLGPEDVCLEPNMGCTVEVDASDTGGPGGGGRFIAASAQGTEVFFTDGGSMALTSDSVPNSGQNLYKFDFETGKLTDLTPFASAHVLGLVGLGQEGSGWHLYVTAEGNFGEENAAGREAQENAPNLYEFSQGTPVSFIATLASSDSEDWNYELPDAAASLNGRYLVFGSVLQLTGFDNLDAANGNPDRELFRYDSGARRLVCVSCGPAAARPIGGTAIDPVERSAFNEYGPAYLRRNVLNDGRVVFDTPNALVPGDINGRSDVYLYEGGQAHLISSGTSTEGSSFYEASGVNPESGQEGEDVFFATSQHLVGAGTGNGPALYDARVDGGFPEPPAETAGCSEESCRGGAPSVSVSNVPASSTFTGLGNITPTAEKPTEHPKKKPSKKCKKGSVRRHSKCVKRKHRPAKRSATEHQTARRTSVSGRSSHV